MKYIRTKSFITNFESWMEINGNLLSIGAAKYIIVAQADTIEELCDEIVINNRNSKKPYLLEDWQIKSLFEQKIRPDYITAIYGAIWTDKGLIYVAKMSEKGELELI